MQHLFKVNNKDAGIAQMDFFLFALTLNVFTTPFTTLI